MEEVYMLTKSTGNLSCTYSQGTFDSPACDCAPGPTQFKNPDCFNPTNFLDKGKFQGNDAFMPSGASRRGRGPSSTGSGVHSDDYAPVYPGKFYLLPVENPSSINLTYSAPA
ncbi:hypothetical protein P7K49_034420 [Saguinus oedipus]|uniref:Uncharacterized protein n=1 Tax=Saguinus oedipus TaxID=9490 RepID=A0ABQ9TUQ2_SAGOE|nr:hypothetical protein P7K49_034420 [Saguinus oedipus]